MKFLLVAFIFCFQSTFGQADSTIYIKEFGWAIKLPSDFKITDSATLAANDEFAKENLKKAGVAPNAFGTKHLITATKGRSNSFSLQSDNSDGYSIQNWELKDSLGKEMIIKALNNQTTIKPEITPCNVKIDGVIFKKLLAVYPNEKGELCFIDLGTYRKGKFFEICYFYMDNIAGKEIEAMISTSKFDK
jgi:hypothetical protein